MNDLNNIKDILMKLAEVIEIQQKLLRGLEARISAIEKQIKRDVEPDLR